MEDMIMLGCMIDLGECQMLFDIQTANHGITLHPHVCSRLSCIGVYVKLTVFII